jgi:hypothetical protein
MQVFGTNRERAPSTRGGTATGARRPAEHHLRLSGRADFIQASTVTIAPAPFVPLPVAPAPVNAL